MLPRFMTLASGAELPFTKLYLPDMKSESLMSWVLATRLPTSRTAPFPNRMPFGFTRNTCPFDVMFPKMLEGLLPMTRFRMVAELSGCRNCTYWFAPTEKDCQLITAFWLVWVILVVFAFGAAMVAAPPTTCPPVGFANATKGDRAPKPAAAWLRCRPRRARRKISWMRTPR